MWCSNAAIDSGTRGRISTTAWCCTPASTCRAARACGFRARRRCFRPARTFWTISIATPRRSSCRFETGADVTRVERVGRTGGRSGRARATRSTRGRSSSPPASSRTRTCPHIPGREQFARPRAAQRRVQERRRACTGRARARRRRRQLGGRNRGRAGRAGATSRWPSQSGAHVVPRDGRSACRFSTSSIPSAICRARATRRRHVDRRASPRCEGQVRAAAAHPGGCREGPAHRLPPRRMSCAAARSR